MEAQFPDTQGNSPRIPIHLTRVGVSGVKKLIKIGRCDKRPIVLLPTFNAFLDLPSNQKGIHMSRNLEAISDVVEEVVENESVEVESLCANIVNKLMAKHEYAEMAEVSMKSDFMFIRKSPVTQNKSQEMAKIIAKAVGYKKDGRVTIRKSIGAEVIGMTVCPCAQESVKETDRRKLLEFLDEEAVEKVINTVTFASHNQRGIGTIIIEIPENQTVNGEDIIKIIEDSMSSNVCEILKRPDENAVVMEAHDNPYFVEDCVRNMVEKIIQQYSHLPDDTLVTVRQVNEESIHRHNAFAEKIATMETLKSELSKS
ncbi:MAG: GTP cyclohydrolase MptA [Methanobrevibacter sp.]|jgi:GTP cyclohydrolase-4|nr:GTP cyclohydrolase MptA [Candidatus Methanovirga aequatorialis]